MIERKRKNKMIYLLLVSMVLLVIFLWLSLRPVKIVAVHQDRYLSHVLVKSFPFTSKGKIKWWLKNRYIIPEPDLKGFFTINFWLFGDGYKEMGKYARFCFDDMKIDKNCIEKDIVLTVKNNRQSRIVFTTYNGKYIMEEDGKIFKLEH